MCVTTAESPETYATAVKVIEALARLVLGGLFGHENYFRIATKSVQLPDGQLAVRFLIADLEVILHRDL